MKLFQRRLPVWFTGVDVLLPRKRGCSARYFVSDCFEFRFGFGVVAARVTDVCRGMRRLSARTSPYHSKHSAPKSQPQPKLNKIGCQLLIGSVSMEMCADMAAVMSPIMKMQSDFGHDQLTCAIDDKHMHGLRHSAHTNRTKRVSHRQGNDARTHNAKQCVGTSARQLTCTRFWKMHHQVLEAQERLVALTSEARIDAPCDNLLSALVSKLSTPWICCV